jgi:DNA-binding transcriptional LysR family regulator
LLDDLHALVEFAQAGSIAGAADRLYRTPFAITRQLQRLEAALGAELLDRSVKPPRLNSLGSRVLGQARDLLHRTEAMKSVASRDAEPHGLLRIGLAHALAEGTLIKPIRALTEKYPKVRLRLLSDLTSELIAASSAAGMPSGSDGKHSRRLRHRTSGERAGQNRRRKIVSAAFFLPNGLAGA